MHNFYVAYQFAGPNGSGFGFRIVPLGRMIDSAAMVLEMVKRVEATLPADVKIVPLNWIRLF
jgi:hypothetical protein